MSTSTIRSGMMAYMGLAAQVQAEQARAQAAAELAYLWRMAERPVAATKVGNTRAYQTHYMADVQVSYKKKHIVVKGQLSL